MDELRAETSAEGASSLGHPSGMGPARSPTIAVEDLFHNNLIAAKWNPKSLKVEGSLLELSKT